MVERSSIMTANIQKWGNSYGIKIPKHMLEELKWSENETVSISIADGRIIIESSTSPQRKNIKALFEGFKGKYEPEELDWGELSGREVW